jgi:MFS family permease
VTDVTPVPPGLWNRDFKRLWWSEAISFFGSQLTLFAIPIVALEYLHASASEVAWITTAAGIGTLVFLGFLAPWTDRGRRTRFLFLMSVLRAAVLGVIGLLFFADHLSLLVLALAAGLISGLTGLYDSAFSALVPGIVHRSRLPAANTWVAGIRSAGDIGAGATAGILLQIFSPLALFLADAVTYVISAFSVRRVSEAEPEPEERLTVRRYASSIVAGFRMLYRSTVLWPVTLAIAHFNLFTAAIQAIYITHALRSGSMSPAEVGVAGALGGVLGLLSMAAAPRIWDRLRPINALALTFALPAVAGIGMLALVPGRAVFNVALLALSLGLWATSVMTNVTGTETLKQVLVPERALGSFSAASRIVTWGIDPLGAALAAVLTLVFPTGVVLALASLGIFTSAAWVLASRAVRRLPRLASISASDAAG